MFVVLHAWAFRGGWEQDFRFRRIRGFGSLQDFGIVASGKSHLAGRDDLQRAEGDLEVGGVALEVVQSLGNVLLQLGGVGPRGAVGSDLVQGGGHLDCCRWVVDGRVSRCCNGRGQEERKSSQSRSRQATRNSKCAVRISGGWILPGDWGLKTLGWSVLIGISQWFLEASEWTIKPAIVPTLKSAPVFFWFR